MIRLRGVWRAFRWSKVCSNPSSNSEVVDLFYCRLFPLSLRSKLNFASQEPSLFSSFFRSSFLSFKHPPFWLIVMHFTLICSCPRADLSMAAPAAVADSKEPAAASASSASLSTTSAPDPQAQAQSLSAQIQAERNTYHSSLETLCTTLTKAIDALSATTSAAAPAAAASASSSAAAPAPVKSALAKLFVERARVYGWLGLVTAST